MRKFAVVAALSCAFMAACSVDELVLTEAEIQDLVDNFEAAQTAYTEIAEFTLDVALGEADIDGYTYDAPTADNAWTGTLSFTGDALPSGSGTLVLTFQVIGDTGPVDPFSEDLSDDENVSIDGEISFEGVSTAGAPLSANGAFSWTGTFDYDAGAASVTLNADLDIGHNDYTANLVPDDFTIEFDLDTEEASGTTGEVRGSVDIPNFLFDADVFMVGAGLDVETTVDVVGNTVTWLIPLSGF